MNAQTAQRTAGLVMSHENYSTETLRACEWVGLGVARRTLEEYGHTFADLVAARLVCPLIPAPQFRDLLVRP